MNFVTKYAVLLLTTVIICDSGAAQRTILMVDDHPIHTRPGTRRVLHKPVRGESNPVVTETKPWESAIGYCSVHRNSDSGRYQAWYQAYAGGRAKDPTRRLVVAYAESDDGVNWIKPNLGLFDFNQVTDTNIVLVGNGGRSVNYGASVLVDAREIDIFLGSHAVGLNVCCTCGIQQSVFRIVVLLEVKLLKPCKSQIY